MAKEALLLKGAIILASTRHNINQQLLCIIRHKLTVRITFQSLALMR